MAFPGPPTIFLMEVWTTQARICASPFVFGGTHDDTQFEIIDTTTGDTVVNSTTGVGQTHVTVPTINLVAGRIYRCRIRYKNVDGFGIWSDNFQAKVASELDLPAITVPREPRAKSTAPFAPDFLAEVEGFRDFHEHLFETDHVFRRTTDTRARRTVRLTWVHLSFAKFATLRTFILDLLALDPPEAFLTPDSIVGGIGFFPRQSRIQSLMTAPNAFTLSLEADEVFQDRPWTVEVSVVGGPDKIS